INPGNSGGPIFTISGELVGISTAAVSATNIGFAVPVHRIRNLLIGKLTNLETEKFGDIIRFRGEIADAFDNVEGASLNIVETDDAAINAARRADGTWDRVKGSIRSVAFEEKNSRLEASLNLEYYIAERYVTKHYVGQVVLKMANGSTVYQPPFRAMAQSSWGMTIGGDGVEESETRMYNSRFKSEKK
ncbi:MAG: trypsin-like serine protease, partial [Nevskiales bacterium]